MFLPGTEADEPSVLYRYGGYSAPSQHRSRGTNRALQVVILLLPGTEADEPSMLHRWLFCSFPGQKQRNQPSSTGGYSAPVPRRNTCAAQMVSSQEEAREPPVGFVQFIPYLRLSLSSCTKEMRACIIPNMFTSLSSLPYLQGVCVCVWRTRGKEKGKNGEVKEEEVRERRRRS